MTAGRSPFSWSGVYEDRSKPAPALLARQHYLHSGVAIVAPATNDIIPTRLALWAGETPGDLAMEADRWQRIEELYHSALDCPPELRPEFLAQACDGNADLLRDLQDLLAHDQTPCPSISLNESACPVICWTLH